MCYRDAVSLPGLAGFVKWAYANIIACLTIEPSSRRLSLVAPNLESERSGLLSALFRFAAVAGLAAYLPGVVAGAVQGIWAIVIVDTVAYAVVVAIAFLPRIRPALQLGVLIALSLSVGIVVLVTVGPLGAGYLWILFAMVISALFGNATSISLTVVASMALMALWALALTRGIDGHGATPAVVGIIAGSLLTIGLSLSLVIHRLLRGLSNSLEERGRLADSLALELRASMATRDALEEALAGKDELLRELQHRVRNNLQTIMSLLALEGDDGGRPGLERARRRVRALAVANDHFLSRPDEGKHDAWYLARAVAQALGVRASFSSREGSLAEPLLIDAHVAPLLAIMAGDILYGLAQAGSVVIHASLGAEGGTGEAFIDFLAGTEGVVAERGIASVLGELRADRIARSAASELFAVAAPAGAGIRLVIEGHRGSSS